MKTTYQFPKSAAFGKILPKSKIYEYATPTTKVKDLFIAQVEKITWAYKLSPATINLAASDAVQEIQVFHVALRTGVLSSEVLQTIDNAIPSPILFVLQYKDRCRYVAAYKRPSETDKNKWVVSRHFETDWISDALEKTAIPIVMTVEALYHFFLKEIIAIPARQDESVDDLILRVDELDTKEREARILSNRINKEKQFNRRVEMNRTLNELKAKIAELQK